MVIVRYEMLHFRNFYKSVLCVKLLLRMLMTWCFNTRELAATIMAYNLLPNFMILHGLMDVMY